LARYHMQTSMSGKGKGTLGSPPTMTQVTNYFEAFMESKEIEGLKPRTLEEHRLYFERFVDYVKMIYPESWEQAPLTSELIRKYILYMKNEKGIWDNHPFLAKPHAHRHGLSPVTINIRLRTLKCFFRFLTAEGYLKEDINAKVKLLKTEKDKIIAFDETQVKALLNQPNQSLYAGLRDYVLMLLLLDTGLRISEALGLTVNDIDFKTNSVTVPARLSKNGKSRVIPMSVITARALLRLKTHTERVLPEEKHLFLTQYGNLLTPACFRKQLTKYARRAGVTDVRVSPHTFRHTMSKFYILRGGDAFTLQRILGHSSLDMVRVYIQMFDSDVRDKHERFSPVQGIVGPNKGIGQIRLR
jgi:integrase/recombinase XerD